MMHQEHSSRMPQLLAGAALITAAVLGMLAANTAFANLYQRLITVPLELSLGDWTLSKPLLLWINDGLMAVFFLLVALELKREVLDGELSRPSQILLPLGAAAGGILAPAAVYVAFNSGDPEALRGWAIPAATDIAFALGVLAMLGDRVPKALKAFLLSVAVFDDLGAILIIAAFYTEEISWAAKGFALVATAGLLLLNRLRVRNIAPYLLIGAVLWFCVLKSGVHATLAGVVVGLCIPHRSARDGASPLLDLEHGLQPWVGFLIVPVFAFANTGVRLTGFTEALLDPVALGIVGGLVAGKMLGVFGVAVMLIKGGWAKLPAGATWTAFAGVCMLSGIGFTMSLFIGSLAFEGSARDFGGPVRLGVLVGSAVSAVVGVAVLWRGLPARSPSQRGEVVEVRGASASEPA